MRRILVLAWPQDHLVDDGFDMAEDDEDPHEKQHGAHHRSDNSDRVALQPLPDFDRRNTEAYVGKHIRVPVQVEIISGDRFDDSYERDAEEPKGQGP